MVVWGSVLAESFWPRPSPCPHPNPLPPSGRGDFAKLRHSGNHVIPAKAGIHRPLSERKGTRASEARSQGYAGAVWGQ